MQHVAVVYIIAMIRFHAPARHSSRLGQRFQVALGAAAALATISLSPGSAQAFVVTVGGVQYDVTTFTGTYNDNISKFALPPAPGVMPWWGSESLAAQFVLAVGDGLGFPNNVSDMGPLFGYSLDVDSFGGSIVPYKAFSPSLGDQSGLYTSFVFTETTRTWAQATPYTAPAPVPGPLPLFGAAAAFGFSRKLRKRIKLAPAALGSGLPQA